jgi:DNA-binding transcriptional LysR family regulator
MHDLNDLYFFAQVVDHGGFAAAARALGMQRSRLSRRVAALEARLGVRLIQRSSRRFSVTEVGQAFYARCQAMLVEAEAAEAVIAHAAAEPRGLVRMSCPAALLTYRMGPLIAGFMAAYPAVAIHLESTSRRVDVIGEGFDLAIRVREPPLEHSDLVMRKLDESVHRLVASPALVAAHEAPAGPADLAAWPTWISARRRATMSGPSAVRTGRAPMSAIVPAWSPTTSRCCTPRPLPARASPCCPP